MLWLTEQDVEALIDLPALIARIETVFQQHGAGRVVNPRETRIDVPELEANFVAFPSYVRDIETYAVKVLAGNERNVRRGLPFIHALVVLLDVDSGRPLAIIEGGYLTACRTAATTAVATKHLARADAEVLGVLGTGLQGRLHLKTLPLAQSYQRILVCSPSGDHERAAALARIVSLELGREIVASPSVAQVVRESDVVTTATLSKVPLFPADLVRPGCHVNVVGAFRPTAMEIEPALLARASVVVDLMSRFIEHWSHLSEPRLDARVIESVIPLAHVVAGQAAPRSTTAAVTVFLSGGMAMEDAVAARLVYERAIEKGIGRSPGGPGAESVMAVGNSAR